jgi:hypothetical protein
MIFQQGTPFSAAPKNTDFRIKPATAGAQMEFNIPKSGPKQMPAVVEYGNGGGSAQMSRPQPPSRPAGTQPNGPSLASSQMANDGDRHVSEVTEASFAAPSQPQAGASRPATPPPPPKPPTPPPARTVNFP